MAHGNPPGDDEREHEGEEPLHVSIMRFAAEAVKRAWEGCQAVNREFTIHCLTLTR